MITKVVQTYQLQQNFNYTLAGGFLSSMPFNNTKSDYVAVYCGFNLRFDLRQPEDQGSSQSMTVEGILCSVEENSVLHFYRVDLGCCLM